MNITEYTHTNLGGIAYCAPTLYGISLLVQDYKSVQHVTVLNTEDNCNTIVFVYLKMEKIQQIYKR